MRGMKRIKKSYFIDKIIIEFRASIGFKGPVTFERNDVVPGSREGYLGTINQLATLTRLERRACGDHFIPCLKRADKKWSGTFIIYDSWEKKGNIVFINYPITQRKSFRNAFLMCNGLL